MPGSRPGMTVVATPCDCGKLRPALVAQTDLFAKLPSAVICPSTSLHRDDADQFRPEVEPCPRNSLREVSQRL